MVEEIRPEHDLEWAAMTKVAKLRGVTSAAVRQWVRQAQGDQGAGAGTTSEESAEVKRLKRENTELKRGHLDLEGRRGFLRGRARPALPLLADFVREHAGHRGAARTVACVGASAGWRTRSPARWPAVRDTSVHGQRLMAQEGTRSQRFSHVLGTESLIGAASGRRAPASAAHMSNRPSRCR